MSLIAQGMTTAEVSKTLRLSCHTVKNHLFHIYEKLGISNRVELVRYANLSYAVNGAMSEHRRHRATG
jgi:DNA-binding CsgD family transcriptional regulator